MYVCIEANLGINKTKLLDQLEAAHLYNVKRTALNDNNLPVFPSIKFCKLPSSFETSLFGNGGVSIADKMMTCVTLLIKLLDENTEGQDTPDIVITDYSLISIRHHVCAMKNLGYITSLSADGVLKVIDAHPDYLKPNYIIFMDFDFDSRLCCSQARSGDNTFSYPSPLYFETYEAFLYKFMFRWLSRIDNLGFHALQTGIIENEKQLEDNMFVDSLLTSIYNKL